MKESTQLMYVHLFLLGSDNNRPLGKEERAKVTGSLVGLLNSGGHRVLLVYCMARQLHVVLRMNPEVPLSHIAADIRKTSMEQLDDASGQEGVFRWGRGYGAASIGEWDVLHLLGFIRNLDNDAAPADDDEEEEEAVDDETDGLERIIIKVMTGHPYDSENQRN